MSIRQFTRSSLFLIAAAGASGGALAAAPGALDPSFDTDGKVTTEFPGATVSVINAIKQRDDGKLVVAGFQLDAQSDPEMTVARYNSDGSLDTAFSDDGLRSIAFSSGVSFGQALATAPGDKLVVAGGVSNGSNWDFALARVTDNGSLDSGFGSGGGVSTAVGSGNDVAYSLVAHGDGRVKAAGYSDSSGVNGDDFALVAYTSTGALDTAFGSGGKLTTHMGGEDVAYSLLQQPDGKLVAAGYSATLVGGIKSFAIARYSATGALDSSFSQDGKLITTIGSGNSEIRNIIRQSDGKLVAVGCAGSGSGRNIAMARYTNSGVLDSNFGSGGVVLTDINSGEDCGSAVIQQYNGKLLVSGYASNGGNGDDFVLVRYTSSGELDTDFGTGGKLATAVGGSLSDAAYSAIEQADEQVVAAGVSGTKMAVVRYLFDDDDNDGVTDALDNCQYVDNADQLDTDLDLVGNACDDDDDDDGVADDDDAFPLDPTESVDTDGDGTGNNADPDDDNDGVLDGDDPFPLDPFLLNRITGDSKTDYAGYSVAMVGDINSDGFADILVGVPKNDVILPAQTKAAVDVGSAYLSSGQTLEILHTFNGAAKGEEFGATVAVAGDVNNDGTPDLIIAAPKADQVDPGTGKVLVKDRGAVTVYSGANYLPLFTLNGELAGDGFGIAVAPAGDVDSDGYGDILVGAWKVDGIDASTLKPIKDAGAVYLYSGQLATNDTQTNAQLHKFVGEAKGDYFGYSVAAGSDLDHNSVADISIGAYKHDPLDAITSKPLADAGSVYVYNSVAPYDFLFRLDGLKGDNFGFAQVAVDAVPDSFMDLVIGSPKADVVTDKKYTDAGIVSLFTTTATTPAGSLHASSAQKGALFGSALAAAGNVDGAGAEEFVVGAPKTDVLLDDVKLKDAGQISVHSADSGNVVFTIDGDAKAGQAGFAVSGGSDHNDDGYDDVVIGAPYAAFNGLAKTGVAKVISGKEASEAAAP